MKQIQNLPTSTYSIVEVENGLYRILKDNQPLLNPHGYEVPAIGLMAAKQAVDELKAGADFTQIYSMLSYIYSYGEFLQTPDFLPEQVDIVCNWLDEGVFGDKYLMLFQDSPVRVAIGSYYANNLPVEIRQMSPMQQVAMICFYNCYCSFVLPYLVYTDIVQKLADDWSNYDDLKESFIDGVREFECELHEEEGCTSKADRKEIDAYLKRMNNNIDTLAKFMAMKQ